jgi:hypothetical protein
MIRTSAQPEAEKLEEQAPSDHLEPKPSIESFENPIELKQLTEHGLYQSPHSSDLDRAASQKYAIYGCEWRLLCFHAVQ